MEGPMTFERISTMDPPQLHHQPLWLSFCSSSSCALRLPLHLLSLLLSLSEAASFSAPTEGWDPLRDSGERCSSRAGPAAAQAAPPGPLWPAHALRCPCSASQPARKHVLHLRPCLLCERCSSREGPAAAQAAAPALLWTAHALGCPCSA